MHHSRALDLAKGGKWSFTEGVVTPRESEDDAADKTEEVQFMYQQACRARCPILRCCALPQKRPAEKTLGLVAELENALGKYKETGPYPTDLCIAQRGCADCPRMTQPKTRRYCGCSQH